MANDEKEWTNELEKIAKKIDELASHFMTPQIFRKDEKILEYKIGDDAYKFKKSNNEKNENEDKLKEYRVILTLNGEKKYAKKYAETNGNAKKQRDDFFKSLKPEKITDFTSWQLDE